jgi:hypothetical protein
MGTRTSPATSAGRSRARLGARSRAVAAVLTAALLAGSAACTAGAPEPPPGPGPLPAHPGPVAPGPAPALTGLASLPGRVEAFLGASRWGRYDRVAAVLVVVDGRTVVEHRRPELPEQRREVGGITAAVLVALTGIVLERSADGAGPVPAGALGTEGLRGVRRPIAELLAGAAPAALPAPLAAVADRPLHEVLVGTSLDDTAALSALLSTATGRPVPELARELLFAPLGIDPPWTGAGPQVTAAEMAALAALWLDRGAVGGRQVVPAAWMDIAARPFTETGRRRLPYAGYRQWLTRADRHAAVVLTGADGQLVEVVPGLDLVVVVGSVEDPAPEVAIPASSEAFVELVSSVVVPALG